MENNAYKMEEFEQRLDRFKQGSPDETILTLLSSIHNCFNNEIKITVESYQTGLLFLGIHAVALTVAYYF